MNDPALRDMYVFPHSIGEYHLIDLIEHQSSVAEPMALGRGGARDHLAAFLIETITSTRCGGDRVNCIVFTWTKDGFISGGTCER